MRTSLSLVFCVLLSGCVASPNSGPAEAGGSALAAKVVVASPGRAGAKSKVLTDKVVVWTKVAGEPLAPATFAIDGNRFYLPDPEKEQVRVYKGSKFSSTIRGTGFALDLLVDGGRLTVLNNANQVRTYAVDRSNKAVVTSKVTILPAATGKTGKPEEDYQHPPAEVTTLEAAGAVTIAKLNDGSQANLDTTVAPVSKSSVVKSSVPSNVESYQLLTNGFNVLDPEKRVIKTVTVPHTPVGIERIAADSRFTYYLVADGFNNEDAGWVIDRYVVRYTIAGEPAGSYTLARSNTYTPNREVVVADGQVYQLFINNDAAQILRLDLDAPVAAIPPGAPADVKALEKEGR